jgi:N-acetylglucosaminyldiphosphoundecaprenol N-acetyl-beta-D-mannosaminyltransferase
MTAPKQEKWIYRNKEKLNVKIIEAVGGVFNFFSGISLALKSPKKLRQ